MFGRSAQKSTQATDLLCTRRSRFKFVIELSEGGCVGISIRDAIWCGIQHINSKHFKVYKDMKCHLSAILLVYPGAFGFQPSIVRSRYSSYWSSSSTHGMIKTPFSKDPEPKPTPTQSPQSAGSMFSVLGEKIQNLISKDSPSKPIAVPPPGTNPMQSIVAFFSTIIPSNLEKPPPTRPAPPVSAPPLRSLRDSKFDLEQRIESVKCAAIGALSGSLATAPVAFYHYAGNIAQFELTTDMAALQGALFAIVYRYAIRADVNPMLNQGVLGAFVLVRTLPAIHTSPQCSALPLNCKFGSIELLN